MLAFVPLHAGRQAMKSNMRGGGGGGTGVGVGTGTGGGVACAGTAVGSGTGVGVGVGVERKPHDVTNTQIISIAT